MPPHEPNLAAQVPQITNSKTKEEVFLDELLARGSRAEIQKYYQAVLDRRSAEFDAYAGNKRPNFEFVNDTQIQTAAFVVNSDGSNPRFKISLEFLIRNKKTESEVVAIAMHEMTHMMDFANNRKYYLAQFEKAKDLADTLTRKVAQDNLGLSGAELDPAQTKDLQKVIESIYSSGYYNVFNDIFVNHNVVAFDQEMRSVFEKMYRETLFVSNDFSSSPEFYQFVYFLLRGENLSEGMRITEGAEAALAKDYEIDVKEYIPRRGIAFSKKKRVNAQSMIDTFLNPNKTDSFANDIKAKNKTGRNNKDTSLEYRSEYIDQTMLATFTELFWNDIHKWIAEYRATAADKYKDDQDKNAAKEFINKNIAKDLIEWLGGVRDKIDSVSPDIVPKDEIEKYADWKEGDDAKDAAEQAGINAPIQGKPIPGAGSIPNQNRPNQTPRPIPKTPEQVAQEEEAKKAEDDRLAKEARKQVVENFASQNNIDPETMKRVAEAFEDVHAEIDDLYELWRRIVLRTENEARTQHGETTHKDGDRFDQDAFVRGLPDVMRGSYDKLKVFNRLERVDSPSDRPERIEVELIADQSSSMGGKDSEKNKIVDRVITMLNMSLDGLNELLAANQGTTRSKLHADAALTLFGTILKQVTGYRYEETGIAGVAADIDSADKGVSNYNILKDIGVNMGNTFDHLALEKISASIDEQKLEKIKSGKILKLAFEITDGGSSNAAKSKEQVEKLAEQGVLVFAFQIGKVTPEEVATFNSVWNSSADGVKRGYALGENFKDLPKVMADILKKYISDVKIYE